MPRVRFHANNEHSEWSHSDDPVVVQSTYGDGETTKIRDDGTLRDGDAVDMDDFEARWCLSHYPEVFEIVEEGSETVDPDNYLKDVLVEMAEAEGIEVTSDMTKEDIADQLNQEDTD